GTTEHQEEEHNPLLPEADELIFGSLAFLIVFLMLQRFAFPAIRKGLQERQQKIQGDLEDAEKAKNEAESSLERYQQQLQEARGEANRVIEEARKTAEQMRRDLLAKAEDEAQALVRRAQEEVRGERDRAVQALRRELAEASVELAARVVGESLDRDRQMRLVDQFIDEVAGMERGSGNGNGG
ncbi:MAG: F0F1 ATP synthase subunit B, partial [Actinomycetota bacterium]|nr:F0F1 ATP synthase subunit B [Actinomycetota bacterium]